MNRTELFRKLGATLKNTRWSWGAVRKDGTVILSVWEDQTRKHKGSDYVRVARQKRQKPKLPGPLERLEHVDMVQCNAPCLLIMCKAKDVNDSSRQIESFNENEVFVGGKIIELDGDLWIQMVRPKSFQSAGA